MVDSVEPLHPFDGYLKRDLIPSVWCSGCGIGTVVNTFVQTVAKLKIEPSSVHIVVGTGCTAKIAEYVQFGKPHVAPGSIFEHALATAQRCPDGRIVVFTSNCDFMNFSPKIVTDAQKKNRSFCLIHLNTMVYVTTHHTAIAATPFIRQEVDSGYTLPFNIPYMAEQAGISYIARWTSLHVRRLMNSIATALGSNAMSFIEVITPCLVFDTVHEQLGTSLDKIHYCHDNCEVKYGEPTRNLDLRQGGKITMGVFTGGCV